MIERRSFATPPDLLTVPPAFSRAAIFPNQLMDSLKYSTPMRQMVLAVATVGLKFYELV